jgi:hypothetical protein
MDVSNLPNVAARYWEACAARDAALAALRESIRGAVDDGMSKNEAIRVSGLARQTVYNVLR